jgi:transposase
VANRELIDDDLWKAILLWLPPERKGVRGGPPRISNRAALSGILFVLRHGLRWRDLPQELGYGSGVTCWRRVRVGAQIIPPGRAEMFREFPT